MKSTQLFSRGFTLTEALVYMSILILLISSIGAFFLWAVRLHTKTLALGAVTANIQRALGVLTSEIRWAQSIYEPTTSLIQLSLETSNQTPAGESSTYVDFFVCEQRLCLKREGQNPIALTSQQVEVTDFQVEEVGTDTASSVEITLEIQYQNPNNRPELDASRSITTTVSSRSY